MRHARLARHRLIEDCQQPSWRTRRLSSATVCWQHGLCGLCGLILLGCAPSKSDPKSVGSSSLQQQPNQDKPIEPAAHPSVTAKGQIELPAHVEPGGFAFEEVAQSVGINFTYRNGEESEQFAMIENMGGGVALFDYDNNGRLDVLAAGGGTISQAKQIGGLPWGLIRQLSPQQFVSVTAPSLFYPDQFYAHGITCVDFNNDGFSDVLVTGFGGISLMQNMGDGTFQKCPSSSGLQITGWATSAAAGDFNQDGIPDLYVTQYVDWSWDKHPFCRSPVTNTRELCSPRDFSGVSDAIFFGDGHGNFQEQAAFARLKPEGKGLGVIALDVDNDLDLDIYVANDMTDNFLYLNRGNGQFDEVGLISGVAVDDMGLPNGSMGLAAGDVNFDGLVDLWVTNFEREMFALYENSGNAVFQHTSLFRGMSALGGSFVGFGTAWTDFDSDGLAEIVVTNGHVLKYPVASPRRQAPLLLQRKGERYERCAFPSESYFAGTYEGRGLAVGDLNDDGRIDIVISHINEPLAVLLNQTPQQGHSLRVRLVGTRSMRDAIGTRLVLETTERQYLMHQVGGGSYLSAHEPTLTFAIRQAELPAKLNVFWPSGVKQDIPINAPRELLLLIEPNLEAANAAK